MALFGRYDAKESAVTIDGINITGLGEDMITFEKDEALSEDSVGAQGDICRSEINNSIYTLTVSVQVTSPQLNFLLALKNRTEPFSAWVINKKLKLRLGGSLAMISEIPEIALGSEAEDIELQFKVYDGDIITTEE